MNPVILATALAAALGLAAGGPALAAPPPENTCPTFTPTVGDGDVHRDAVAVPLREGMVLSYEDALSLRRLIPIEVWRNREVFFFEGMRMEIGPCHRRYPQPGFQRDATAEFGGRARVDAEGNLTGYVAGTPFPPEQITADDPQAGVKWAWNLQMRYRGAGPAGRFRLLDMPASIGSVQTYLGSYFYVQTGHRADLAASDYAVAEIGDVDFVAGGRFDEPTESRHLAWKQQRPVEARRDAGRSDDTFVYVPTMRKMRRAPTAWVDGVYTPRYRVGGDSGGGALPAASGGGSGYGDFSFLGAVAPTAGLSIATAEHIRRGFSDLALRPNAYVWRVLDQREVLAPINGTRTGYPTSDERNFGPAGLSVASDRWDVRWAVVIEGLAREGGRPVGRIQIYVDYLSHVPLYVITKRSDGRLIEVGIPVHRYSGDVIDYPSWPGGERALVFDPVAAVFLNVADGGSGWRREAFDTRSIPVSDAELMRMLSPDTLLRGR